MNLFSETSPLSSNDHINLNRLKKYFQIKNICLGVTYRMLSYLPCGLSADKNYKYIPRSQNKMQN